MEYVQAQLFNKSTYSISVNLEGPKTNQFRIFFQDTNGALYPLLLQDVLNFEINATPSNQLKLGNTFEEYYYHKLGLPSEHTLQAIDLMKVKLVLIPNMAQQPNGGFTYLIGNEFRTSILVVDN